MWHLKQFKQCAGNIHSWYMGTRCAAAVALQAGNPQQHAQDHGFCANANMQVNADANVRTSSKAMNCGRCGAFKVMGV